MATKKNGKKANEPPKNKEANDGNNAEAKKNGWKRFVKEIWQWVYPTFEDTSEADYWTLLHQEVKVKKEVEERKRIPIFNTADLPGIKGVNYLSGEVQGKSLIIPSGDMQKKDDLEKNLMLAYENAWKVNEWLANRINNKRKDNFLFMGFSISSSLLLQRVVSSSSPMGSNITPIQIAFIGYLVLVIALAIYYAWLLLGDSKHKTKEKILPALGDHLHTHPFLAPYNFLFSNALKKNYSNYLISHTEQLTIKFFDLKQRSIYNDRIFTIYFYTLAMLSALLLLLVQLLLFAGFKQYL